MPHNPLSSVLDMIQAIETAQELSAGLGEAEFLADKCASNRSQLHGDITSFRGRSLNPGEPACAGSHPEPNANPTKENVPFSQPVRME